MHQIPSTYSLQPNTNLQFPEHEHLNCPRCDSNNTKFCYYNNYNLSQPRHYCKNCRRYWTKGGTLRKIPIGGGTRKPNKRSSSSTSSNKRGADSSIVSSTASVVQPPPVAQLKPEGCVIFDLDTNRSQISSMLRSEKDDLNRTVDDDRSVGDGGGKRWPELSIFTAGSNLR
ncbi:hypothetical protein QVD17_25676 [Tagetes erecta]|uniref:Dof zinc finger protein n=1 Tax=Tagetes erecta TaxID=13708 RepID=A0AAD8NVK2_TARER|nr:hypothetical protein QVD17_25676 [Tagetes erecta]